MIQGEIPFQKPLYTSAESELRVFIMNKNSSPRTCVWKKFLVNTGEAYREIFMHRYATSHCPQDIVRFLTEYTHEGALGFLMEACKWEDLETMYKRMATSQLKWSETEVLKFALAMLRVVTKLHSLGIIHLGIEPKNWLLTTDNRLKLTDFGRAELISVPESPYSPGSKFTEDVRGLGRTLYQVALLKPYRLNDKVPRDLLEMKVHGDCTTQGYSIFVSGLILNLLFQSKNLNELVSEIELRIE